MNFIEWHIGDWIKHTKGLPHVQRAIYSDLLMAYYTHERPLADRDEAYGECGAGTRQLREQCDKVLAKYFREDPEGSFSHDRADEEIYRYQQKIPEADRKRENNRGRQERTRERRARLFEQLRKLGIAPAYNATMEWLENRLADALEDASRELKQAGDKLGTGALVTPPVTRDGCVTADERSANGTAASPQSPVPINSGAVRASSTDLAPSEDARALAVQEQAEKAAQAMAQAGLPDVNASDPVLQQLLREGMTVPELAAAAVDAHRKGKGAGWALARAVGRRADAAATQVPQKTVASEPESMKPGWKDPALRKLEADEGKAVAPPASVREFADRLKRKAVA